MARITKVVLTFQVEGSEYQFSLDEREEIDRAICHLERIERIADLVHAISTTQALIDVGNWQRAIRSWPIASQIADQLDDSWRKTPVQLIGVCKIPPSILKTLRILESTFATTRRDRDPI